MKLNAKSIKITIISIMIACFAAFAAFLSLFCINSVKLHNELLIVDSSYVLEKNEIVSQHKATLLFSEEEPITTTPPAFLTGDDLEYISISANGIIIKFTEESKAIFNEVTQRLAADNSKIYIFTVIDEQVILIISVSVNGSVVGDSVQISGSINENLMEELIEYSLPVKLNILNEKTEGIKAGVYKKFTTTEYLILFIVFLIVASVEGTILIIIHHRNLPVNP